MSKWIPTTKVMVQTTAASVTTLLIGVIERWTGGTVVQDEREAMIILIGLVIAYLVPERP